jgi:hypothetical protein
MLGLVVSCDCSMFVVCVMFMNTVIRVGKYYDITMEILRKYTMEILWKYYGNTMEKSIRSRHEQQTRFTSQMDRSYQLPISLSWTFGFNKSLPILHAGNNSSQKVSLCN